MYKFVIFFITIAVHLNSFVSYLQNLNKTSQKAWLLYDHFIIFSKYLFMPTACNKSPKSFLDFQKPSIRFERVTKQSRTIRLSQSMKDALSLLHAIRTYTRCIFCLLFNQGSSTDYDVNSRISQTSGDTKKIIHKSFKDLFLSVQSKMKRQSENFFSWLWLHKFYVLQRPLSRSLLPFPLQSRRLSPPLCLNKCRRRQSLIMDLMRKQQRNLHRKVHHWTRCPAYEHNEPCDFNCLAQRFHLALGRDKARRHPGGTTISSSRNE